MQDQRDVKALFLHLVETLADVSAWGGQVGAGAADGLKILKIEKTGEELDAAGANLAKTEYPTAASNQRGSSLPRRITAPAGTRAPSNRSARPITQAADCVRC